MRTVSNATFRLSAGPTSGTPLGGLPDPELEDRVRARKCEDLARDCASHLNRVEPTPRHPLGRLAVAATSDKCAARTRPPGPSLQSPAVDLAFVLVTVASRGSTPSPPPPPPLHYTAVCCPRAAAFASWPIYRTMPWKACGRPGSMIASSGSSPVCSACRRPPSTCAPFNQMSQWDRDLLWWWGCSAQQTRGRMPAGPRLRASFLLFDRR